jgi:hypothetical protein
MCYPPVKLRDAGGIFTLLILILILLPAGCASRPTIDWSSRIGSYTYDQAVMDYGPPDKSAVLSDQTLVAEWLTSRGAYHSVGPTLGYGPAYRRYGYHPGYAFESSHIVRSPDRHLRLIFDPSGNLQSWQTFSK